MLDNSETIIAKKRLSDKDINNYNELQAKCKISGILVGAVYDKKIKSQYPLFIEDGKLKILKTTFDLKDEDLIFLDILSKKYKELKSLDFINKDTAFGLLPKKFWVYRNFYQQTLEDYLEDNILDLENANSLLMSIINLLLELQRNNITHGHITTTNIIFENENIKLIDYYLAYLTKKDFKLAGFSFDKNHITPNFSSDIYSLKYLISKIYKNLNNPIPTELLEKISNANPKLRPNINEVSNEINIILTKNKSKKIPRFKTDTINPLDYTRSLKVSDDLREEIKDALTSTSKNDRLNNIIFYITLLFITIGFYKIELEERFFPSEEILIEEDSSKLEVINPIDSFSLAKDFLKENNFKNPELIDIFSNNIYSKDLLPKYFFQNDSQDLFVLKLQALILIYADKIDYLDKLFLDLKEINIESRLFNWFEENSLIPWDTVSNQEKLLLVAGNVPKSILIPSAYFDLFKFPISKVQIDSLSIIKEKYPQDYLFYNELFKQRDKYERAEIIFLMLGLFEQPDKQLALVNEWFKNIKINKDLLIDLVLARKPNKLGEDIFSLLAVQYILPLEKKPSEIILKKFIYHHEVQLRAVAVSFLNASKLTEKKLLQDAYKIENNERLKQEIERKISLE